MCAGCGGALHEGDRFCRSCGRSALHCLYCGHPVNPGDPTCASCGATLGADVRNATPALVAAPPASNPVLERLRAATAGEFQVLGQIGQGGMAAVFLAQDLALRRNVAIKVIAPGLLANAAMVQRFREEAVTVAKLHHPNIITLHGVRDTGDLQYFIMQFVEGCSLEQIQKAVPTLPVAQARGILAQVGSALAYAHRHGVIHRDIKPANLLVDGDGNTIVTDFGIAKVAESQGLTQTGLLIGTPAYMSPEQFQGTGVTWASDQYSLGVVAYQLMVGRPPFQGGTVEVMQAHLNQAPAPLRGLRPDCPPDLEAAILRMLAKEPAARWPSMAEVLRALGAVPLPDGDPLREQLAQLSTGVLPEGHERGEAGSQPGSSAPGGVVIPVGVADRIVLVAAPAELEAGESVQLRAVARDARGGTVSCQLRWSVDAVAVAEVDGETGLLTGLAPGRVVVTVSGSGLRATAAIAVGQAKAASIGLTVGSSALEVGDALVGSASPRDRRGAAVVRAVRFYSSDPAVASVTDKGTITGLAPGAAEIVAECDGVHESVALRVVRATAVAVQIPVPAQPVRAGDSVRLSAQAWDARRRPVTDGVVTWTSSEPAVATVSAAGVVAAQAPGLAIITARVDGAAAQVRLNVIERPAVKLVVSDPPAVVRVGEPFQLDALALDDRGSRLAVAVGWRSSSSHIAKVSASGLVTPVRPGRVTLTTSLEQLAATMVIEVIAREAGGAGPAAGERVSVPVRSRPGRRAVIAAGLLLAAAAGVAGISIYGRAAQPSGPEQRVADSSRAPPPSPAIIRQQLVSRHVSLQVGDTFRLQLDPAAGGAPVQWRASGPAVVTVTQDGVVRGIGLGSALVMAEGTTVSDTARIEVTAGPALPRSIAVTPGAPTMTAGATLALAASVLDGEGRALSGHALEWSARNPAVVDVDRQTGLLKATSPGRATIEVRSGELRATVSVVVTPAVVARRDVSPDSSPARAAAPPPPADTARPETPATFLVRSLAAGGNSACVALRSGGTACWGAGSGAPATVDARAFDDLAVGGSHRCGLAGGVAHCWGSNGMGQLGDGSTNSRSRPAPVQGGNQFTAMAAGGSHTCALDRGGKAYCWGSNAAGQLGIGRLGGLAQVPTAVQTDLTFQAIAAGKQHTCALDAGGAAYCWGDGFSGALGNNMTEPQDAPFPVDGKLRFRKLAAGDDFTCGLTTGNQAYCWGDNRSGQVGDRSNRQRNKPAAVARNPAFTDLVAGRYHACGLTADGRALCWGDNSKGQLGNGTTTPRNAPEEVEADQHLKGLAAGSLFTCAQTASDTVVCWGDNAESQLGAPGSPAQTTPVAVRGR